MLVRVANWLRWRRLAKASPAGVRLTHGAQAALWPVYCSRAIRLLSRPASSQPQASPRPQADRAIAPPVNPLQAATHSNPAPATTLNSHCTMAALGPKVTGFSQGSATSTATAAMASGWVIR